MWRANDVLTRMEVGRNERAKISGKTLSVQVYTSYIATEIENPSI